MADAETKTVPLSIHEAAVAHFYAREYDAEKKAKVPVTDSAIGMLERAVKGVRLAIESAASAHATIMSDPMATRLANAKKSRDSSFGKLNSKLPEIDRAIAAAQKTLDALEKETLTLVAPRRDAYEVAIGAEIRQHFRGLKNYEEQRDAIAKLIGSQDERSIAALIDAPAYLSGLSETQQSYIREAYRVKKFPREFDRMERIRKAIAATGVASDAAIKFIADLTPSDEIKAAEAKAAAARKAAAVAAVEEAEEREAASEREAALAAAERENAFRAAIAAG